MKTIYFFLITAFTLLFSCKKEKETTQSEGRYTFKDQKLQGILADEPWELVSGKAQIFSNKVHIDLYKENITMPSLCDELSNSDEDRVSFHTPIQTKVVNLSFSENPQHIAATDGETNIGYLISNGKLELTKIDSVNNIVEGRIVAIFDYESEYTNLNGHFSVPLCD